MLHPELIEAGVGGAILGLAFALLGVVFQLLRTLGRRLFGKNQSGPEKALEQQKAEISAKKIKQEENLVYHWCAIVIVFILPSLIGLQYEWVVGTCLSLVIFFRWKKKHKRISDEISQLEKSKPEVTDQPQSQPEQVVPITPPVNIDNYPNAKMVIEYKSQAATHWQKIQEQPEKFRISFLEKLENDPTQDIMQLSNYINAEIEKSIRPFEDENTNNAYIEAGKMGVEAAAEFKRVQDLLGSTLTSDDMLAKIKDKYGTKVDNSDQLKNLKFSDSDQGVVELTDNAENNKTDGTLETPNLLIQLFHVMKNALLILIIGCFIIFIIEKFLSIDLGY